MCRTLPRSGYTEQPRVLTLGQVVSKGALPVRRSSGMRDEGGKVAPDIERVGGTTRGGPKDPPRPPLFLLRPAFPELRRKGRAVLALRIPRAKALGCSVWLLRAKSDNHGTEPFYPGSSGTNCQDFGELSRVATII